MESQETLCACSYDLGETHGKMSVEGSFVLFNCGIRSCSAGVFHIARIANICIIMLFKIDGISQRSSMLCRLLASKISPL